MARIPWKGTQWYRDEYLKSPHWIEFAKVIRGFWGHTCCLCYKEAYDVHHRTYERLGEELITDVVLLCRMCHEKHHDKTAVPDDARLHREDCFNCSSIGRLNSSDGRLLCFECHARTKTIDELIKSASECDDSENGLVSAECIAAMERLEEIAWDNGLTREQTKAAKDWRTVGDMIKEKKSN